MKRSMKDFFLCFGVGGGGGLRGGISSRKQEDYLSTLYFSAYLLSSVCSDRPKSDCDWPETKVSGQLVAGLF